MSWLAAFLGFVAGAGLTVVIVVRRSSRRARHPRPLASETPAVVQAGELDRLRVALDALPVGIVVADSSGQIVVRNRASVHAVGSWQGDVLVDEAAQALLLHAVEGRAGERTLDLYGPPRRVIVVRALPVESETGVGGAIVVIDDVTDRARIDAVRTDFVANISHELKTPVGAMTVLAEALADSDDPADVRRLSSKVVSEADRLSRTIDDLLELSRIELGGIAVSDPVLVEPVLDEAVERIEDLAARHGITVYVKEPFDGCELRGDRRQLVSALGNLVENAVKYSECGGSIEVSAEPHGDWIDLVVADHGIGIPERDLDRVFERFYRVDRARSRETGGTGLGLSIVRHVATNHGGTVTVTSVEGEGSTFRLTIPAGLAPATVQETNQL